MFIHDLDSFKRQKMVLFTVFFLGGGASRLIQL